MGFPHLSIGHISPAATIWWDRGPNIRASSVSDCAVRVWKIHLVLKFVNKFDSILPGKIETLLFLNLPSLSSTKSGTGEYFAEGVFFAMNVPFSKGFTQITSTGFRFMIIKLFLWYSRGTFIANPAEIWKTRGISSMLCLYLKSCWLCLSEFADFLGRCFFVGEGGVGWS